MGNSKQFPVSYQLTFAIYKLKLLIYKFTILTGFNFSNFNKIL